MQPVKYTSPTKSHPNYLLHSPEVLYINTQMSQPSGPSAPSRRVWIKKPDGTPASLFVKESHIVDDLKTMIIERFPTTLAKVCDPSDVIIRLDPMISPTTPNRKSIVVTALGNNNTITNNNISTVPMNPSNTGTSTSMGSPISPIPILAKNSSFDAIANARSNPLTTQLKDFSSLSLKAPSPRTVVPIYLEPDRSVWQILDTYFPHGMTIDNSLIIELPPQIQVQLQYQQAVPLPNTNPGFPGYPQQVYPFAQRKSLSTETILEAREGDSSQSYLDNRRMNNSLSYRSQTPSSYRKSHSKSADQSSAVLLLPSSSQSDQSSKKKRDATSAEPINSDPFQNVNSNLSNSNYDDVHANRASVSQQPSVSPEPSQLQSANVDNTESSSASPAPTRQNQPKSINSSRTQRPSRIAEGTSTMAKVLPSVKVLIVEDNLVNLRILSAHLRRHGIHYDTAKNGKEAIEKWRRGGFHLVLMDIQLPVMSGLEASREIRRLEKINHIGVFAKEDLQNLPIHAKEDELDLKVFRSPIIIVALTASNLKQDKQEALTAGCNDYLTKPVNLDWLLNKITEWGCMQALIDFDGWKSGERMTNISAAIPKLNRNPSTRAHS